MDNQEDDPKQPPTKLPDLTLFEQANSDFALAASQANSHFALGPAQDNSRFALAASVPARLSTIESEEETGEDEDEDEEDDEETGSDENDYEYFESQGFGDEDGFDEFLDEQESDPSPDGEDFMEEDEIDPDELSYEELIALGEFIGVEKCGLTLNEISVCLCEGKYVSSQIKNETDRCVICQMEYENDESLVVLRPCEHPFHSECITKWLQMKKICPICGSEASSAKPENC